MPEMTAMPILPAAATPASPASAPGGWAARNDKASNSTQAANNGRPDIGPGAVPGNDDKSFASVLQRQLDQAAPTPASAGAVAVDINARLLNDVLGTEVGLKSLTDATAVVDASTRPSPDTTALIDSIKQSVPDFKPVSDATALIDANGKPVSDATVLIDANGKPVSDATALIDANGKPVSDATALIDANGKAVSDPAALSDANARPIPDLTVSADAHAELVHDAAAPVDTNVQLLPDAPLLAIVIPTQATQETSLPTNQSDDAGKKDSDDGLTAASPYLLSLTTSPNVKLENSSTKLSETDSQSATAREGNAPQTPLVVAMLAQAKSAEPRDGLPAKPAEMPQAAANKTAEFAAGASALADPAPVHAAQAEKSGSESNFENMLASAQAAHQSRSAGAHASNQAAPALPIETPVGGRGWDGEVSDKLVWMVGRQEQRAELILNPPQLGRVEVSLSISGGQTSAIFTSANPAVRDALEAAMPRLREILADAGISLGQAQVGADTGSNQASNQSTNNRENWDNLRHGANSFDLANGIDMLRPGGTSPWLRQSNSLVDVFA